MTLSDDSITAVYDVADTDQKRLLLRALSVSHGESGQALLRSQATDKSSEASLRSVAVMSLRERGDASDTSLYVSRLADRSIQVQIMAAIALAEVGDSSSTEKFLTWAEGKLARKGRGNNWDPRELPAILLHLVRHGELRLMLGLISRPGVWLAQEELDGLHRLGIRETREMTWTLSREPDLTQLQLWLHEDSIESEVDVPACKKLLTILNSKA